MTQNQNTMESLGTPSAIKHFGTTILQFFKQMAQRRIAFASMLIVFIFIIIALVGPLIAPYEFDELLRGDDRRLLQNTPPSVAHILGTDSRGRDIYSRLLWGARETIGLPAVATTVAVTLGTIMGLMSGYHGGWIDELLSRVTDSLLAIPALVLALVMITTIVPLLKETTSPLLLPFVNIFGATAISLTIVVVLLYTPIVTRVVRSATLTVRDSGYIEAAKLRGESSFYIMFREIFPSVLPALVVEASLRLSYAIFLIASLGFLGLGVQPPSPEWGRMVFDARDFAETAPWTMLFPIMAIATLIISINLMSDGLRRVLRNEDGRE